MDVTPLIPQGRQIIQSYGGGTFKISGRRYPSAIMVTPEETTPWNFSGRADDISTTSFDIVAPLADQLDVLLLGTGDSMAFVPPAVRAVLRDKGVTIDVMDTGAACRTYNVLMAEGRRVAALLIPTGDDKHD